MVRRKKAGPLGVEEEYWDLRNNLNETLLENKWDFYFQLCLYAIETRTA